LKFSFDTDPGMKTSISQVVKMEKSFFLAAVWGVAVAKGKSFLGHGFGPRLAICPETVKSECDSVVPGHCIHAPVSQDCEP
jgi:hypothetical protein